jgi:hypothetical protein
MRSGRECQRLLVLWFLAVTAFGSPCAGGGESFYDVTLGEQEPLTSHDCSARRDARSVHPSRSQSGWATGASCPARVDFVPVRCAGRHECRRFYRICLVRSANVAVDRRSICRCGDREPAVDELYALPVGLRRLRTKARVVWAMPTVRPSEASNQGAE